MKYGLIGKSLSHSFSKSYFTKKFADEGLDHTYDNFELETITHLPSLLAKEGLAGFNVTIPYKESVVEYLDEVTDIVKETGACNCVHIVKGRLIGYNTDVTGFEGSFRKHWNEKADTALILGTGGSSKAVQYVLRKLNIRFILASRNRYGNTLSYAEVDEAVIARSPIIINTTPLGMYPDIEQAPEINYEAITPSHLLFDLIYNPPVTKFLQEGIIRGATVCNGEEMLIGQAEESWRIWNAK